MFMFRQAAKIQKRPFTGVRYNSSFVSNLSSKLSTLSTKTIYWSKVVAELSKQVYAKEGLAPPKVADFQTVYKKLYADLLVYVNKPEKVLTTFKELKITKDVVYKTGSYAVQLLGLFSLGEIIGRRKIVGYPDFKKH